MITLDSLCLRMLCSLPLLPVIACDLADPEEETILERSSSDFTTRVVGPNNSWSEQTPYLTEYVDLVCDPTVGCTNMPAYERMVYDITSDDPIFVRGKTDGDGGLSNGITYEKFVSSGHWAAVAAPYIVQLNTPYTENGQQVTDTTFRIVHKVNSGHWSLNNGVYETPSTWMWFPTAQGEPIPDYELDVALQRCGDGIVTDGLEECDDGNTIGDDGCEQCKTKTSQNTIYVAGGLDFYKYSITSNQWTTKPALPTLRGSTLTNDAASVYYADRTNDHKIYKFNGTSWSLASIPAVTAATDSDIPGGNQDPRDLLVWFDDGYYYVNAYKLNTDVHSRYELWVYRTSTGQWTLRASGLAHHNNSAGQSDPQPNGQFQSAQWDRASQRLYLKFNQGGFAVVDTTAGSPTQDSIVQWRHDDPNNYTLGDQGSAFAFSGSKLYRWSPNTLRRYTEQSGNWGYTTVTTTPGWGSDGAGSWNSSFLQGDTDHANGAVYVFTGFKFKRFDPSSNTLTPLTNGNISAPDITVMRPL